MEKTTVSVYPVESNSRLDPSQAFYDRMHLIFAVLSAPLSVIALYLFTTQIVFSCLKENQPRNYEHQMSRSGSRRSFKTNQNGARFSRILNVMTSCGALGAFLEAAVDFRYTFGRDNDLGCQLSLKFKVGCHSIVLLSVYLVFWLRQRILYQHRGMKHLSTKFTRFMSLAMLAVIVCGLALSSVIFIISGRYRGSTNGCAQHTGSMLEIRWIIVMGCTAIFHICLLILFIHPLIKHSYRVKKTSISTNDNSLIPLVQRATVAAVLCVLSDITAALFVMLFKEDIIIASVFVCDAFTVFNVFCMIFSFGDWKTRLRPWHLNKEIPLTDAI